MRAKRVAGVRVAEFAAVTAAACESVDRPEHRHCVGLRHREMRKVDGPEQRLQADNPHCRRGRQQLRDALGGSVLVLGADAERHVRKRQTQDGAMHAILERHVIGRGLHKPPQIEGAAARLHPLWSLRQHLKLKVRAQRHHRKHAVDHVIRDEIPEQTAH
jgi:hypothetical protein